MQLTVTWHKTAENAPPFYQPVIGSGLPFTVLLDRNLNWWACNTARKGQPVDPPKYWAHLPEPPKE